MKEIMKFAILLLLPLSTLSQEALDTIVWSAERPLRFADFKANSDSRKKDVELSYLAITTSQITIETIVYNDSIEIQVLSLFYCDSSWMKKESLKLLSHEQGHFDITEIFTREVKKSFSKIKFDQLTNEKIEEIFEVQYRANIAHNLEYDKETGHGVLSDKQKFWKESIATRLNNLYAYSGRSIIITK
jgi:hypothetical protein